MYATDLDAVSPILGEASTCSICGNYIGLKAWLPPYRAELTTWGIDYGDLVFLLGDEIAVSQRLKSAWEASSLQGLRDFDRIEIVKVVHRGPKLHAPPEYFRAAIAPSRAAVDTERSVIRWDGNPPTCSECRLGEAILRVDGLALEGTESVKTDLFLVRGLPGTVFANERFRDFVQSLDFKNISLTPIEDFRIDYS